jgi:hypothetical protein
MGDIWLEAAMVFARRNDWKIRDFDSDGWPKSTRPILSNAAVFLLKNVYTFSKLAIFLQMANAKSNTIRFFVLFF